MKIIQATNEHFEAVRNWELERLEQRTCRPVVEEKRIPRTNEVITFSFVSEELQDPAGIFFYFDHNPRNRSCEFGYIINPQNRNQGIGTKMVRAAIERLFCDRVLNLNKLYCQTAEFNLPSVRVLQKIGFHRDAILREHHELDGKFWADYIYSILRSEWINNIPKFKQIETERLLLTGISRDDADDIFNHYNEPEIYSQYEGKPLKNKQETFDFIEMLNGSNNVSWAIKLKTQPKKIIGVCALHDWDKSRNIIEIGGSLASGHWRRGIMHEAFSSVIEYALEELGVIGIEGKTLIRNKAAIGLLEKLGFLKEGIKGNEITYIRQRS